MTVNILNVPVDSTGAAEVTVKPTEGVSLTQVTHNFCDRLTWWSQAVQVVDEIASANGTFDVYSLAHQNIIDTTHSRITKEIDLPLSYKVLVKVNDIVQNSGYTVNYSAGTVTFLSALSGSDVVKVSYYYENGSDWVLTPQPGKLIRIVKAEIQFSEDVDISNVISMAIKVGPSTVREYQYKSAKDFINEANLGGQQVKAFGELTKNVVQFEWRYPTTIDLKSSLNMSLHIRMLNNEPIVNISSQPTELATGSFYCVVMDE